MQTQYRTSLTASEILSSVKCGGLKSWSPACEIRQKEVQHKPNSITEKKLSVILTVIGTKQLTAQDIAESVGESVGSTRDRLVRLIHIGKLRRSTNGQPYLYYRVNN